MRALLADYQLRGAARSTAPGGAPRYVADPPRRLGLAGQVLVTELPDPGPGTWPACADRLAALAAVRSPHLVELYEAGREDGAQPCTWVASGGAEWDRLRPAPVASVLRSVAGAARGAHALHESGLAHGAITADAILVGADGAGALVPPVAVGPGGPGDAVAADRHDLDGVDPAELWGEGPARTGDVWSLAATVHYLIGGGRLHPGIDEEEPLTALQRVLYEPVALTAPPGHHVGEFLRACLSLDPDDRPPTAAAMADHLDTLAGQS